MRAGLIVVLVGAVFLLKNLGLISGVEWSIIWPIIAIYIGIAMIARSRCWHCGVWHDGIHLNKKGSCDCESCGDCGK